MKVFFELIVSLAFFLIWIWVMFGRWIPRKPQKQIDYSNIQTLAIVISTEKSANGTYESEVKYIDIDGKDYLAKISSHRKLAIGDVVKIKCDSNNKNVAQFISN